MSNNDKANGYNALKVSKFDHSSTTPRATRWREWVIDEASKISCTTK
jgi:hypothetical protein